MVKIYLSFIIVIISYPGVNLRQVFHESANKINVLVCPFVNKTGRNVFYMKIDNVYKSESRFYKSSSFTDEVKINYFELFKCGDKSDISYELTNYQQPIYKLTFDVLIKSFKCLEKSAYLSILFDLKYYLDRFLLSGEAEILPEIMIIKYSKGNLKIKSYFCYENYHNSTETIKGERRKSRKFISVFHSLPIDCLKECDSTFLERLSIIYKTYIKFIREYILNKHNYVFSIDIIQFNSFVQCPENFQLLTMYKDKQTIRSMYCLRCPDYTGLYDNQIPFGNLQKTCYNCPFNSFFNLITKSCDFCEGLKIYVSENQPSGSADICSTFEDLNNIDHYLLIHRKSQKTHVECWPWYMNDNKDSYNISSIKFIFKDNSEKVSEYLQLSINPEEYVKNFRCIIEYINGFGEKKLLNIPYVVHEVFPDSLANYFEEKASDCPRKSIIKRIELKLRKNHLYYNFVSKLSKVKMNPIKIKIECGRRFYRLDTIQRNTNDINNRKLYEFEKNPFNNKMDKKIRVWIIYEIHSSIQVLHSQYCFDKLRNLINKYKNVYENYNSIQLLEKLLRICYQRFWSSINFQRILRRPKMLKKALNDVYFTIKYEFQVLIMIITIIYMKYKRAFITNIIIVIIIIND